MAVILQDYISEEIYERKTTANAAFEAKDYDTALALYLDILAQLPPRPAAAEQDDEVHEPEPEMEDEQVRQMRSVIYANVAATHLRLEQWKEAVAACNQSLLDQPSYVKALYRRAQANEEIGGWAGLSAALQDHQTLLTHIDLPASTRPAVVAAIARIQPLADKAAQVEKDEMMDKLKGIGDSLLGTFGLSTKNFQFTQQEGGGYSMNFVR